MKYLLFLFSFSGSVFLAQAGQRHYKSRKVLVNYIKTDTAPSVQSTPAKNEPSKNEDKWWGRNQEVKKTEGDKIVLIENKKSAAHSKYFEKGLKAWKDIDFKKAYPLFLKAAAEGDADAYYYIGSQWLNNFHEVVARIDIDTAKYYFQKGIDNGSSLALYGMGQAYKKQSNDANALYYGSRLGKVYDSLNDIKLEYYKMAANAGCAKAINIYFQPISPYQSALYCATKSAEAGDARGMINLGMLYQYGWGIPVNKEEAKKWFNLALKNWIDYNDKDAAMVHLERINESQPRRAKTVEDYGFPSADYKEQRLEKPAARDYTEENKAYYDWWQKTYGRGGTQNSVPMPNNNTPQASMKTGAQSEADRHKSIMDQIYRDTEKQMNRGFKNN